MPARRSACALPDAITAGSSVGCLPRSVSCVLLSRGAAGGETRALVALVMPPRWCASLLARIRRASGVSSRAFCRLLPANTTSQSMRPVSSPLAYSLYRPCRLHRPSDDCRRTGVMWRSLVTLSRLVTRASLWGPPAGATCRALWASQKMRRACLRLRAKGIRCSCRTAFAVERDILARVVSSRASSMGPTSSIPHGKSMLGEDCSLWLKVSAAGVDGVSGFLAEGSPHSPSECGGMVSEGVRSHQLECLLRFV